MYRKGPRENEQRGFGKEEGEGVGSDGSFVVQRVNKSRVGNTFRVFTPPNYGSRHQTITLENRKQHTFPRETQEKTTKKRHKNY